MAKQKLFSVTIADCKVDTFRSGGKGGQNVNKVNSGVRVTHQASGAVGKATDERDQPVNKKLAFKRMTETKEFQTWLRIEIHRRMGTLHQIEAKVEADMKQVKVESKLDGKWVGGLTGEFDA